MTRIAIIDHDTHTLFVEDIADEILAKYNGEEEEYIRDNYTTTNFSWDYIVDAEYIPNSNDPDPYEIVFEDLI